VLKCADEITVICMRPEPAQLLRQFRASELDSPAATKRTRRQRWHHEQLLKDFESEERVASWYERWRDFVRAEYPKAGYHELAPVPKRQARAR
jgi:hypothetical protein